MTDYDVVKDLREQLGSAVDEATRLRQGIRKILDEAQDNNSHLGVVIPKKTVGEVLDELEKLLPLRRRRIHKSPNETQEKVLNEFNQIFSQKVVDEPQVRTKS